MAMRELDKGGKGGAHGLGQDNAPDRLPPGEAGTLRRLQLAPGHRLQGGPHCLGAVSPLVDGEDDDRGGEGIQDDAQIRQSVKYYEQLHQDRRSPDDPDVKAADLPKHRDLRKLNQSDRRGDDHG